MGRSRMQLIVGVFKTINIIVSECAAKFIRNLAKILKTNSLSQLERSVNLSELLTYNN
jgi:hypothetical protein